MLTQRFLNSASKAEQAEVLRALYAKIPDSARRPFSLKSWAYLLFDTLAISALFLLGHWLLAQRIFWLLPVYFLLQGSFFWSLFLIGHDAGHDSFSPSRWQNWLAGGLSHSFLLIPFYSWKLSHQKHHTHPHHVHKDESHVPLVRSELQGAMDRLATLSPAKRVVQALFFLGWRVFLTVGLAFVIYIFRNHSYANPFSHFDPKAPIFRGHEKKISVSVALVFAMAAILAGAAYALSVGALLVLYLCPLLVFYFFFYFVTFLQHMSDRNQWFYDRDWTYLKGALQTVDYDYGWAAPVVNFLHHNIQRYHVIHHLDARIPHYGLPSAAAAIQEDISEVYLLERNPLQRYRDIKHRNNLLIVEDFSPGIGEYRLQTAGSLVERIKALARAIGRPK